MVDPIPAEPELTMGHPMYARPILAWCGCGHAIYNDDGWATCEACGKEKRIKEDHDG